MMSDAKANNFSVKKNLFCRKNEFAEITTDATRRLSMAAAAAY